MRETFGGFFADQAALQLYSFKEPRKRPPFMESIDGSRVSELLELTALPQWAWEECKYFLRDLHSVIYGGARILRKVSMMKWISDSTFENPLAEVKSLTAFPGVKSLTASPGTPGDSWEECERLVEAAASGDVMKLDFIMYNQLDDERLEYSQTKIVATRVGGNLYRRTIYRSQKPILAFMDLAGCGVMVTSFGVYYAWMEGSWRHNNLRMQDRRCVMKAPETDVKTLRDLESSTIYFAALDETVSPPSLVCVFGARSGVFYLVRIGKVDASNYSISEIQVKAIDFLYNALYSDHIADTTDAPRVAAVPGFAIDDHGRIWIRTLNELRVYSPDFELADCREISGKFEIYGADGEVHLRREPDAN